MTRVLTAVIAALTLFVTPVFAQGHTLLIADASSSGTYKAMLGQLIGVCSSGDFEIKEAPGITGGATDNLDALVNNKVAAAFLHSDVIAARGMADPAMKRFKTLAALYPEDIHVLTLRNSKTKVHLIQTVQFTSLVSLRGYKVGAAGGGVITARVLTGQGEGHFDVVEYGSGKEVIAALDNNEIQAAIFVGGAPLPNIETLSGDQYKLIPIDPDIANRVSSFYRPTVIQYNNLRSGPIHTIAPMAIIVTRQYTIPSMVQPQREFRQCLYEHLGELQQTPGMHPKWQLVDPNEHGMWDWYEIPSTTAATTKH